MARHRPGPQSSPRPALRRRDCLAALALPWALGATLSVAPQALARNDATVIKLPTSALRQMADGTSVWVVDKATMTVKAQPVQVATADGNEAVIASGLQPGLLVVSAGVHVLSPRGEHLGMIPTPRRAITIAFSGPEKNVLYAPSMGAVGPDGKAWTTPELIRNTAMTIYRMPLLSQGYKGRPK